MPRRDSTKINRPGHGRLAVWVILGALLSIPYPQPAYETAASASGPCSLAAPAACGGAVYFALPGRGPANLPPDGTAPRLADRVMRALGIHVEQAELSSPYALDPYFYSPRVRQILKDNAPYLLNRSDRFFGREPSPLSSIPAEPARRV